MDNRRSFARGTVICIVIFALACLGSLYYAMQGDMTGKYVFLVRLGFLVIGFFSEIYAPSYKRRERRKYSRPRF